MITRSGWCVAGISAAVLGAGWWLGYEELLVLGLAGLLVFVTSLAWVAYRPQVEVRRELNPDRVTVGEPALGVLTVTNSGRRSSPPMVASEVYGNEVLEIAISRLPSGQSRATPYQLPTARRGVIQVGPLTMRRADPFGLVATGKRYGEVDTLWVHPRVHAVVVLPSGLSRDLDGPTSDTSPQGGMAFHALREYVHGDDLRQIHWRSSARTGTLMVRHMVDSSQPVTTVVLDTRRPRFAPDRFEHAVEAAASIITTCRRENFPVSFHTTDGAAFASQHRAATMTEYLDHLAGVSLSDGGDIVGLATQLRSQSTGGALVFLTGRPDISDLPVVSRLRRSFDHTVVVRFHDELDVTLHGTADPSGVPGALVINAGDVRSFVQSWNRLGRR